ncbi:MAG: MazG nucleotide pyrophosphohydrolase domain-containing protein [Brevinema sp.]
MDEKTINEAFTRLWDVVCTIREKCPWDQRQTLETLAPPFLEEAYEALEAVEMGRAEDITEEFGDVFFMLLMLIRIAQQEGFTSPQKIIGQATDKLIARHPHVYGDNTAVSTPEDVSRQWEAIKKEEKSDRESVFDGIPKNLPPSMRLQKILKKSKVLGHQPSISQKSDAQARLSALLLELHQEGEDINTLIANIARDCENEARAKGL